MNPVEAVLEATTRYLSALEGLTDEQLRDPSLLPGWSRGHVAAHLALNAHGFARALRGARTGDPVPIYDSQEARDAEVEERSSGSVEELAAFNQMASLRLAGELRLMKALVTIERTPGGHVFDAAKVVEIRWKEVEIHHADLGIGYGPADWPLPFAALLLESAAADRGRELGITLHARDIDKTVLVGQGGHGVAGPAGDLAWWLVGRGASDSLTSTRPLPELGAWK
ncbi:maleylpyruvate isomerase family mycothiol-dependent enzyme [Nocardioides stalactiti]|uniref:maleylpyruvate isomerase family mycothiol-dependent enzyme n=1 Tax=Nocardioides stalactiti TaxID=2755356 RepID=UPI0016014EB2|nr:maleylpyruvate isomerase family mycothiol-dependent enzyme [Nocardioides stalactiti]